MLQNLAIKTRPAMSQEMYHLMKYHSPLESREQPRYITPIDTDR
jgi:hypothetical protein